MKNKAPLITAHFKIWLQDGVVHTEYCPDLVMTLEIAKKIVADRIEYVEGVSYPGFADIRNLKKVDVDAMRFMASEEAYSCVTRVAVYSNKYLSKILFNFWLKLDKPFRPTKYFTNKGSAYLYLKIMNSN